MSNGKLPLDHRPALHPPTEVLTRGFDPLLSVGSARPAVFRSSTYVFSSPEAAEAAFNKMAGREALAPGERVDLIYSRFNHPNAEITEDQIVPLEMGAQAALVFNSGMAAIMTALMAHLRPGDALIYTVPVYGGTQHLIEDFLTPWGIRGVPVVAGQTAAMEEAILATSGLRVVLLESPANPTLVMSDIARAAAAAHSRGALVMVDNTFMGPAFQHPLRLGADLVLYSATKYLGGFSDLLAGVVLARDPQLLKPVRSKRSLFGNILPPDESWILNSRLPTVTLRMNKQSKNAQRIAEALVTDRRIAKIYYPTLFDDPEQIRIRVAQCEYPGAVFALELRGGKTAAFNFLRALRLARNAVSLGGVETLVCHPKSTTHSGFSEEACRLAGVTDGLVRVSVGIEDWRDLVADFRQALEAAS